MNFEKKLLPYSKYQKLTQKTKLFAHAIFENFELFGFFKELSLKLANARVDALALFYVHYHFKLKKGDFHIFRTKQELKMSNEKNENLQNVSFIHDSSLLLIKYDESYLQYQFYKEDMTRCNSQLIADTYTQSGFQNDAFRSRPIKSQHSEIIQPIRELASV